MIFVKPGSCCLKKIIVVLFLVAVTLAVYWPVQDYPFVDYDEEIYITGNPHVRAGMSLKGLQWAFTNMEAGFWHPLTWLSHMLDYELYRMNAGGHHWTSVLLHVGCTVMLFLFLFESTGAIWPGGLAAALFALHPLHVESVAWAAERKDVLSTFFWMLTLYAYVYYVRLPGWRRYFLVLAAFILGLMAKPMLISLPFVLLLLDYWPLKRLETAPLPGQYREERTKLRRLVIEKIPLLILAFLATVITFIAEKKIGAIPTLDFFPFGVRLANALVSYVVYMEKMVWPTDMAVFYPYSLMRPLWQSVIAGGSMILISILVLKKTNRYPYLGVGWLWYLGTLVPVIGLIQVGYHGMADRYTYVPLIGLFVMICWGGADIVNRRNISYYFAGGLAIAVLIVLTMVTWTQLQYWKDSETLFLHATRVTHNNNIAHNNLAAALAKKGDLAGAVQHLQRAIQIWPDYVDAHENLGLAFIRQNKPVEAVQSLRQALHLDPRRSSTHYYLGVALNLQGQKDLAVAEFREAIRGKPNYVSAIINLGNVYLEMGNIDAAIREYQSALNVKKDNWELHNNLAVALAKRGDINNAITHFNEAFRLNPDLKATQRNIEEIKKLRMK